jgi:hypothetical protein
MRALLLLAALGVPASAELPGFYKQVDRIVFVVPDLQKALEEWKPSGVVEVFTTQPADFQAEYKGRTTESSVRFAAGRFGDVIANWLQPVSGSNAFTDFLKRHGPGVFALMHRVGSLAELEAEVARMRELNVGVLQRGSMGDDDSRYVLFDTQPEGKYTLGIYYQQATPPPAPAGMRRCVHRSRRGAGVEILGEARMAGDEHYEAGTECARVSGQAGGLQVAARLDAARQSGLRVDHS